jgi:formate hydrogenlyase subunit 6/NADH:ubiquinone oxidoreductase subunit I
MDHQQWLPRIDQARCTGCGDCIALCPTGALGRLEGKASLINAEACTYCTACEDICPAGAIELPFLVCKSVSKPKEKKP